MFIKNYDKCAIIEHGEEVSYSELLRAISSYTSLFSGVKRGHRVAIFAENRSEWFYAFLAAWKNEAIPVPIDQFSTADEIAYILNDCKPDFFFISDQTKKIVSQAMKKVKKSIKLLNVDKVRFKPDQYNVEPLEELSADDTAVIIYTSGTTGSPKGVMLTYDNILANIESVSCDECRYYSHDTRAIVLLPLHHSLPLIGTFLIPLHVGGTVVFCPSLTGEDIMTTLQNYQINLFVGVPRLYEMIIKAIRAKINAGKVTKIVFKMAGLLKSKRLSKILFKSVHQKFGGKMGFFISGGAALEKSIGKDFETLAFEVAEGYGMTETAPMISCPRPGKIRVGSVGVPITNTEVKIIDGEVCCRGRNVMKGYYNRPDETAEAIKDGWLHTGDLGYFDWRKNLHINGRIKELIILSNGKNINPVEIEQKLEGASTVINEVAIIEKQDLLTAVIRLEAEAMEERGVLNVEEYVKQEIIDPYNRSASSYKKIKKLILTSEEFPRTRLGKIQRYKLNTLVSPKKEKSEKKAVKNSITALLSSFIHKEIGHDVQMQDHIEIDIGMDSLDKLSLLAYIRSTFNMEIDEELLSKYPTIQKISDYIGVHRNSGVEEDLDETDIELPQSRFPHVCMRNIFSLMLRSLFSVTIEGRENIPVGPYIVCANHQSAMDWPLVASSMTKSMFRSSYIFAKAKHFKSSWRKFLARRANIIILDVNRDLDLTLQKMDDVIDAGKNLVLFPEGTRSKDGRLLEFKKTFANIAKAKNVPILPIAIDGAYKALPKSSAVMRLFKPVRIVYLPAVYPAGKSVKKIIEETRTRIEENIVIFESNDTL